MSTPAKLSERVRPDSEAAPWVIEEIKALEAAVAKSSAALRQMNGRSCSLPHDPENYRPGTVRFADSDGYLSFEVCAELCEWLKQRGGQ